MMRRTTLLALVALASPAAASAQSLLNAAGLGFPTEALDARTRALGGVGIGLQGAAILPTDPAAAGGFALPTATITAQPSWVDFGRSDTGEAGRFRGARFPSIAIAYPVARAGIATFSYESVLDQRYEADHPVTVDVGQGPETATDHFVSRGGVAQIRVGFARTLGDRVSVGVSGGRYTGSLTRRLERTFPSDSTGSSVEQYQTGGFWNYSGAFFTGGASVAVGSFAHLAGSVTWSSSLKATPSQDTKGQGGSFDMPLKLRVGGTAVLAPGLILAAGYTRADWSGVDNDLLQGTSAGTTTSYGVGIELARARLLGKNAPLRFGYRTRDLPFVLEEGRPTERVWAGGLGLNLAQTGDFVRAAVDLALEKGDRTDAIISESFWRGTITVRVSGF
ncbi:MAG: hypothetical protein PVJ02_10025 [Gemmatimonadota bacterium]|jgi:hypothetical protein